jgi:TPR repeat protein
MESFFADGMAAYERGDYATAMQHWHPLAAQGLAMAQCYLGLMYEKGQGVPQNDATAVSWYRKAADQGNAWAQANLALSYSHGRADLPKDEREAARLFKLAADQGNAWAHVHLGLFCGQGRGGLPKDDREAARLFKLAADQGNTDGQSNLGSLYAEGAGGMPKDDREAARLFKLAADQGNPLGQANLGSFYSDGRGGLPKDDHEAARLFKLAADRGNSFGQVKLGFFYSQGRGGLPKDEREAVRFYKLAAEQGDAWAQAELTKCEFTCDIKLKMKTTVSFAGLATSFSKDGAIYTVSTIHRKEFGGFYQTSILRPPLSGHDLWSPGRMLYRIEVLSQLQSAQEHIDAVRMALSKPESTWVETKDYQDNLMNELSGGGSRGRSKEMAWTDRKITDLIFAADIGYQPGVLSRFFGG